MKFTTLMHPVAMAATALTVWAGYAFPSEMVPAVLAISGYLFAWTTEYHRRELVDLDRIIDRIDREQKAREQKTKDIPAWDIPT